MLFTQAVAAADLKVLTTPALKEVWTEFKPKFEATGQKLDLVFAPAAVIAKRVGEGKAADAMFSTCPGIESLIKDGKVIAGTGTAIADSGTSVGVLKGAPKPDISPPEKFKQALLAAKPVAYTDPARAGASGALVAKMLERLGIAKEINAKTKLANGERTREFLSEGRSRPGGSAAAIPVRAAR
jgi:molybdate transport system substrate-binding protein